VTLSGVAESVNALDIPDASKLLSCSSRIAAAPATCGQAIDVPLIAL